MQQIKTWLRFLTEPENCMYNYIIANYKNGTPRDLKKRIPATKVLVPSKGDKLSYKPHGLLINWGTRTPISWFLNRKGSLINDPTAVDKAINKRKTLACLWAAKVPCLEFTEDLADAKRWLSDGRSVFGRLILEGSAGDGIILANQEEYKKTKQLPEGFDKCKLYTRNFPKEYEARVHVFRDEVLHYSEKKKVNDGRFKSDAAFNKSLAKPDFWIRNHSNGWVFCHDPSTIAAHPVACSVAKDAVRALGLDFGAVDVLIAGPDAVVCEVNTAPGLEGKTLEAYVTRFNKLLGNK